MISNLLRPRLTDSADRLMAAGLVAVRHRGGNPYLRRDWLRVSRRLAHGLSPTQAAVAEGRPVEAVDALLEQDGFCRLVEAQRRLMELPVAEQRARLVKLARIAIECALADWDLGAACFVLNEEEQGRDPAVTLTEGVLARQAAPPQAPAAPRPPAMAPRTRRPREHQPLLALVRRSEAGLRRAMVEEHAILEAAAAAPPAARRTTAAAAQRALALRQAAVGDCPATPVPTQPSSTGWGRADRSHLPPPPPPQVGEGRGGGSRATAKPPPEAPPGMGAPPRPARRRPP